ncbi:MAG TPA: MFS transporter, partial [Thermoplasmata archaeon]|nr:MFS transporter [Thermoplasmata archaeon]
MRREDRRVVAVLGFLHGVVHANILSIPIFLLAWQPEFGATDVTLGLLAAVGFGFYGLGAVPFGFLADRRPPGRLLLLCAAGIATSMVAVAASPSIPFLALSLGALGLFSGIYHPTGLSIISRVVAEQGRGMGWHGMGGSLGIAAGPAFVGATLAIGWSWRSVAGLLV